MKKFFVVSLILSLILLTAIIKNSTKRIDEEIFSTKENLRDLKKDFEIIKLEYEYLSSAEKLLELHEQYFDNKLIGKKINEIKIIRKNSNKTEIDQLKFKNNE